MSDDTQERPPQPKEGSDKAITHHNPCGDVILWPNPLVLQKGTVVRDGPNHTKETRIRYSVDNFVAFIPPKGSKTCTKCSFMQFVNRSATDTATSQPSAKYSHPWQPDIKDWNKRKSPTFLDPMELIYDSDLVEHDTAHHALVRRDGPGFEYPAGQPPVSLLLHWDYKVYIVCKDADDTLKLVGLLEFSFDIEIDDKGVPTLKAPGKGQPGYPKLTSYCCNYNEDFLTWIDQWHAHNLAGKGDAPKSLRSFYSALPAMVDETIRSRRALYPVERKE
jgi:hypothetical protein